MKVTNPNNSKGYIALYKDCECFKNPDWRYGNECKCGSGIQKTYEVEPNGELEIPEFSTGIEPLSPNQK